LIKLDTVLVEEKWRAHRHGLFFVFVLLEGAYERFILLLAERAHFLVLSGDSSSVLQSNGIFHEVVVLIGLSAWRVCYCHGFLPLLVGFIMGVVEHSIEVVR